MNNTNRGIRSVADGVFDSDMFLAFIRPSASSLHTRPADEEGSMTPLPLGWTPGHCDVICERGKESFEHAGNKHFRACINTNIDQYVNAKTRQIKSDIVTEIFNFIRDNPDLKQEKKGEFVKRDLLSRRWYQVSEKEARDKVGQALRDTIKALRANSRGKGSKLAVTKTNLDKNERKATRQQEEQPVTDHVLSFGTTTAERDDPFAELLARTAHHQRSSGLGMIESPISPLESLPLKRALQDLRADSTASQRYTDLGDTCRYSAGMDAANTGNPFKRRRSSLGLSVLDSLFNRDETSYQEQHHFSLTGSLFGTNQVGLQSRRNPTNPSSRAFFNNLAQDMPAPFQKSDGTIISMQPPSCTWKLTSSFGVNDMETSRRHSLSMPFGLDFSSSVTTENAKIVGRSNIQNDMSPCSAAELFSQLEPTPLAHLGNVCSDFTRSVHDQ